MTKKMSNFSLFVSVIASLGGLLYGYNTSVISGTILFIKKEFRLSDFQQEVIVSTLLIGALIGAFLGGILADKIGRKKTLLLTILLFFFGIFSMAGASGYNVLVFGRFVTGLGIGIVSMAAPLYIAEMSPRECRGSMVAIYQLAITVGILIAYIVSYFYAGRDEWRQSFSFAFIPVVLQAVGLLFIPETPSWLMSHQRKEKAEGILEKLQTVFTSVKEEDVPTSTDWKELFSPMMRKAFVIGVGVSVFQQITGINTVIYYAPQIFQKTGSNTAEGAIFATVLIGVVNVLMTVVALWIIDRIGRRPLLMGGLAGMAVSLAILGLSFMGKGGHLMGVATACLMVYIACFAVSWGPATWIIISEIYPLGVRGRAVGIAIFANWVSNYFVSLTFLSLIDFLGAGFTFWFYTLICLAGLYFVFKMVPETRGKTFEQIQNFWKK